MSVSEIRSRGFQTVHIPRGFSFSKYIIVVIDTYTALACAYVRITCSLSSSPSHGMPACARSPMYCLLSDPTEHCVFRNEKSSRAHMHPTSVVYSGLKSFIIPPTILPPAFSFRIAMLGRTCEKAVHEAWRMNTLMRCLGRRRKSHVVH